MEEIKTCPATKCNVCIHYEKFATPSAMKLICQNYGQTFRKAKQMTDIELFKIKKRIEEAKTQKAQAEGKLENIYEQLKAKYGCSSPEKAEVKLAKLGKEIKKVKQELEVGLDKLKGDYDKI